MRRLTSLKSVAMILATCLVAVLPPASGTFAHHVGHEVRQGQSIQAAIEAAPPGSTIEVGPGTYRENLHVIKDHITLQGAGPGRTVLTMPDQPSQVCKVLSSPQEAVGINGICVGNVDDQGHVLAIVHDVRVTGFTIQGFEGVGIVFAGTSGARADHNVAANNGGYGITAFESSNGRFEDNTAFGSADAGIYLGDSPNSNFVIRDNTAHDNLWGVLVRDSSVGRVSGNTLIDSCSGLVFLNTGAGAGVHDWIARENRALHNNNLCASDELPFTLTGVGILIAGGQHIQLRDNVVRGNHPKSGATPGSVNGVSLAGGIVLISTADISVFPGFTGSVESDNAVVGNRVTRNQPFDLAYDQHGTGNRFRDNDCRTSTPAGLCD
jgi:parallel beta-helix repeat protein